MSGQQQQSKADRIAEVQANLPLPEQPPVASDWNSADARTVNVGSGKGSGPAEADINAASNNSLNDQSAQPSGVRVEGGEDLSKVGRQAKDGLDGLPKDATAK